MNPAEYLNNAEGYTPPKSASPFLSGESVATTPIEEMGYEQLLGLAEQIKAQLRDGNFEPDVKLSLQKDLETTNSRLNKLAH